MDSAEIPKPQFKDSIEKVTPHEFVSLVLDYLDTDYRKEVDEINRIEITDEFQLTDAQSDQALFAKVIVQAARQLKLDLPNIISSARDALEGKKVKIIQRPGGSFFYTGELLDQDERPKEKPVEWEFKPGQGPEIVETLRETLENRPRQDLSSIAGFSDFFSGLDRTKSIALKTGSVLAGIESQARLVARGEPIKIVKTQGQTRLTSRAA